MRRLPSLLAILIFWGVIPAFAATEIPFEFRDGLIWLKVQVGAQNPPTDFLFDSGASVSVIDVQVARRQGLSLGSAEAIRGVSGSSVAYPIRDIHAEAGGIALPHTMLATDLSNPSAAIHHKISGLLGADFLAGRIVSIDYQARRLRLLSREEGMANTGEWLPLAYRNGAPCVKVGVNGRSPEWMRLDTGCDSSLEWVTRGPAPGASATATVALASGHAHNCLTEIQIGARHRSGVPTGIHPQPMFPSEAGLIGNGLLSSFVVVIDTAGHRVLLADR